MSAFITFEDDTDHLEEVMLLSLAVRGISELAASPEVEVDERKAKSIAYVTAMLSDGIYKLAGELDD